MVALVRDRVLETTTVEGIVTLELGGAVTGFRSFASAFSNSDEVYYVIEAVTSSGVPSGDFEVGTGTFSTGAPNTLSRTTVLASSNGGAKVNFGAGTKHVYCGIPASLLGLLAHQSGIPIDASGVSEDGAFYGATFDQSVNKLILQKSDDSTLKKQGIKEHPLPFGAWHIDGVTDPAGSGSTPETYYGLQRWSFVAGNGNVRYLECLTKLPKSWDAGTFTLELLTTSGATTAAQWKFFVRARCFGSEDNSDGAWGTAQSIIVNKTTARDAYELIIDTTPAITPANTPAKGDWLNLQLYRDPDDADDTYAFSVFFAGATLYYTDNAQTDA